MHLYEIHQRIYEWIIDIPSHHGTIKVKIYTNPSPHLLVRLMENMRIGGVIDINTNDMYVFDRTKIDHGTIIHAIKIDEPLSFYIDILDNKAEINLSTFNTSIDNRSLVNKMLKSNKVLQRATEIYKDKHGLS